MLNRFYQNHVLANLVFVLVLVVGTLSYILMPRQQDPTINFNWINISTLMPGASATDMEKRVTDILEQAIRKIPDVRFVSSSSRESVSNILVRFNDIGERVFDKRVIDLRREIRNKEAELPVEASDPVIFEVTSANAFPSATVVISGPANDENLRFQAELVRKDIERIKGVDRVVASGLADPELHIEFLPQKLTDLGLSPHDLANTVAAHYRDVSAGQIDVNQQNWLIRLQGTNADPAHLATLPVQTAKGEITLDKVAEVKQGRERPQKLLSFNGRPGVMLAITKQADTNLLDLVERIADYVEDRNRSADATGVGLHLADDQTQITRNALRIMQNNAALGLLLVLLVTWLFLGSRISLLTCIGIPFILAGSFWFLRSVGQTINVSVLLGVVISLGMLVDDAVVVVESIYYRLQRGMKAFPATMESLKEVAAPVTTAVLTTMAAFLPLMLMPGILGQFMLVIPLVVSVALAISLVEAFWMLPAHVIAADVGFRKPSKIHRYRVAAMHWIRIKYSRLLIDIMRWPKITLGVIIAIVFAAGFTAFSPLITKDFFASDPVRLFYVNVQMPVGTPLQRTMAKVLEVESLVQAGSREGEARSIVSYAGQMFTETAPFFGDHYGQILVSLNPKTDALRTVDEMIEVMRDSVEQIPGPERLFFLRLAGGPPVSKPISIKVRGNRFDAIERAAAAIKRILQENPNVRDITDDAGPPLQEYALSINTDAARRAGLDAAAVARNVRLLVDGEVVASMQHRGEKLELRVRAKPETLSDIDHFLDHTLHSPLGAAVPLRTLVHAESRRERSNIRHYNFRRTITVEADIDKDKTDTVAINDHVKAEWGKIHREHASINLDFSGVLDDIEESIASMAVLFLLGIGLMYMILGTQFRSYFQPFLIMSTVPLAFTGVVIGLLITQNPLSLFTLYGVVALAGIAVNAAIVLISAANDRLHAGMSVLHATIYSARRRVVPILITSLTTIAGLFALATGLGGHSLLWGPVAASIVFGLTVSTLLTLIVIPLLYRLFMGFAHE